jgi:hypothetical protein
VPGNVAGVLVEVAEHLRAGLAPELEEARDPPQPQQREHEVQQPGGQRDRRDELRGDGLRCPRRLRRSAMVS